MTRPIRSAFGHADDPSPLDLGGLFSAPIRAAVVPIEDHTHDLHPIETKGIATAVESRQHEFSTGRWLARGLLAELGQSPVAIPRARDRTPCWPPGWIGSITHSGPLCAVAVARSTAQRGIGIDLEPDRAPKPGLERLICFGEELSWIGSSGEAERGRRCRLVFSAKEAVYKAFHLRTDRVWRFSEVSLEFDLDRGVFDAHLPPDAGPKSIVGRFIRRDGWIVSGVAW